MKRSRSVFILGLAVAAISVSAHAGGEKPGQAAGQARTVSWEEFKDRCANPDKYSGDIQREPRQILVQCADVQREYVASAPGEVPLPSHRRVVTQIYSDKFHVDAHPTEIELATKGGSCFRFKEIEKSVSIEKPMSCAEVLGMKGSADDFCVQSLNIAKGANPKLVQVAETGVQIDTCGTTVAGGGKGDPKPH